MQVAADPMGITTKATMGHGEKSSAGQQAAEAAWEEQRGEARRDAATHTPGQTRSATATTGSSTAAPGTPRLTRSATMPSITADAPFPPDTASPPEPPAGKGKEHLPGSQTAVLAKLAADLQLTLPPPVKETAPNGLIRTNANIAALANHIANLRASVADVKATRQTTPAA
ncbi:hypothetical protein D9615_003501 [Tricholomella constricta]|uniref:Uncharacterized protein n=1 Tax=Tricholomella constricta TaxID=117010 RepID=A0A8H5M7Q3_9AGAR|nr:hypothetical protein D9615_003501 [Tricholomella constricta]